MRPAAFALVLAALALLTGCTENGAIPLADWTFVGPDGARAAVVLPVHLDARLPAATSHYALHASTTLPDALRDRPLTLVFPRLAARVALRVDGSLAESLDAPEPACYRTKGPHSWRIPPSATADGALELELDVEHTWTQSGWIDTVPRLTPELDGGRAFVLQRVFNDVTAYLALGVGLFVGFLYLVVFLTDRRRSNYGWFAVTGIAGAGYPLFQTGLLAPYAGPFDALLAGLAVSSAVIAEMHFAAAHFGLPPPARAWDVGYLAAMGATMCVVGYFKTQLGGATTAAITVPALVAEAVLFLRLVRRRPWPSDLGLVLGGWPFLLFAAAPDLAAWVGAGELLGGVRTGCFAIAVIGLLQTAAMSRAHTKSLRAADDLNAELRRQIEARSRELADALARLGTQPGERSLDAGEVIEGRYAVVRHLGTGGGGAVYLVERLSDRRELAMKVVHGGDDPQRLARLAREAQLAAQVKHDHVIAIVDVDIAASGFVYIVMEYVAGKTLREHRDDFGKGIDWAVTVLAQIASGLAAIHAHGIVHRDLKPANVLVLARPSGEPPLVKISDFGIARGERSARITKPPPRPSATVQAATPVVPDDATLTQTGMIMGTPLYMAPEAVDGARDATPAVDVFAFGVIAYELLAGRPPFRDSPAFAQLEGVSVAPPRPLGSVRDGIPFEVALVVDRCLAFDPEERPTAREIYAILSGARSSTLIEASAPR